MKKDPNFSDARAALMAFIEFMDSMEGDKDKFLKAARLSRSERKPIFTGEQLLILIVTSLLVFGFLGWMYILFNS